VGPSSQGVDGLVGNVVVGSTRLGVGTVSDPVDLLVLLGTVVVTVLTGTGNRVHDVGRVPSSDTGDLSETSVGLPAKGGTRAGMPWLAMDVTATWQDDVRRTWADG